MKWLRTIHQVSLEWIFLKKLDFCARYIKKAPSVVLSWYSINYNQPVATWDNLCNDMWSIVVISTLWLPVHCGHCGHTTILKPFVHCRYLSTVVAHPAPLPVHRGHFRHCRDWSLHGFDCEWENAIKPSSSCSISQREDILTMRGVMQKGGFHLLLISQMCVSYALLAFTLLVWLLKKHKFKIQPFKGGGNCKPWENYYLNT